MKLPRDISGRELANALTRLGYSINRQTGSHIRMTTQQRGEHHVTIPDHDPLKTGTLNAIVRSVAEHAGLSRDETLHKLFN